MFAPRPLTPRTRACLGRRLLRSRRLRRLCSDRREPVAVGGGVDADGYVDDEQAVATGRGASGRGRGGARSGAGGGENVSASGATPSTATAGAHAGARRRGATTAGGPRLPGGRRPVQLRALQLRGLSFAKLNRGAPVEALGRAAPRRRRRSTSCCCSRTSWRRRRRRSRRATPPQEGGVTRAQERDAVHGTAARHVSALTRPSPPPPGQVGALRLRLPLRPPLPADVSVHACVCPPPRLWVSAYLLKPAEGGGGGGGGGGSGSGGARRRRASASWRGAAGPESRRR